MAPNEELERKVEQYEQDKKTGKKKSKKSAIKYALNISIVLIVHCNSVSSSKYLLHLNPFRGWKSLNSHVENIIRLLHQPAISFCHMGIS